MIKGNDSPTGFSQASLECREAVSDYVSKYQRLHVNQKTDKKWAVLRGAIYAQPFSIWWLTGEINWWLVAVSLVIFFVVLFLHATTAQEISFESIRLGDLQNDSAAREEVLSMLEDEDAVRDMKFLIESFSDMVVSVEVLTVMEEFNEMLCVYWYREGSLLYVFDAPVFEYIEEIEEYL